MENMSLIPHYMHRSGQENLDSYHDRWDAKDVVDAYDHNAMGTCADLCTTEHKFSREDQDAFAIQSYEDLLKLGRENMIMKWFL
jgi:acetyl-CoA C-acetyltransferase